ncbi:MAG: LysM peptidoglycan-binding domain-containing protein [Ilumatobacteraceae bacterium]
MSTYNQHSYQDPYYSRDPRRRPRPNGRARLASPQYQFRRRVVAISMLGLMVAPVAWAMRDDGRAVDIAYSGGAAAMVQFDPTAGDVPAVYPPETAVEAPPETAPETVPVPDTASVTPETAPAAPEPEPVVCASKYTVQLGDSWYGIADAAGVKASLIAGTNNRNLKSTLLVGEEICLPPGADVPPVKTTAAPAAKASAPAPSCSGKYTVKAGDSWNRIATSYSVSGSALAAANGKSIKSTLLIGQSLCLPAGAKAPPSAPAASAPSGSAPPAPKTYTRAEMEQLVRNYWPDELEEQAFYVVHRESRWVPSAKNFCCYGLFQLNWLAHQSWMRGHGITDPSQLQDAETNIRIAYIVYQRSNSWRPWCTTNWCPVP